MRLHRFIIPHIDLDQDSVIITDNEIVNQLRNVLRLVPGDLVVINNGNNYEAEAEITNYQKSEVEIAITKRWHNIHEPRMHTALFCAILKRENFELVIQKATELGVKEIYPLLTERTVKTGIRIDRLEKIAKEAAEQSGRGMAPIIHEPTVFDDALHTIATYEIALFCDLGGNESSALRTSILNATSRAIFVGPEGGWSDSEKNLIKKARDIHNNCYVVSLSPLTLRGETAAIIATYLITSEEK